MAELILGPVLRHVTETEATIWVEVDRSCEVTVNGVSTPTWCVEDHHYALVELRDLVRDETIEYTVELDHRRVWPQPESGLPASTIRPLPTDRDLRLIFGSCRVSLPHEPPYVLHQSEHPAAQGIDALRALAIRILREQEDPPDCLLMLGDQVYADDLSPQMRERTRDRETLTDAPANELGDFDEYALAYREAWSEPLIRWLLSTVPTAMIFDDHEVHAQWKISARWQERLERQPWYERHVSAGLMAYWIYQHIGNLGLDELEQHDLLAEVRSRGRDDAGPLLRREMKAADRQASHSRWSFHRDLGRTRLVVIDSRAGRELEPGSRKMINDGEWEWIVERAAEGEFDHLLLASSVPFFLTPGLHHAQAWDAAVCEGAWGRRARAVGEWIREKTVMDHWASFDDSFRALCRLLEDLACGRLGTAPKTIVMLSGDVHHCYLAEIGFRRGVEAESSVWQAVCSAYRKDLAPREKRAMRIGNSLIPGLIARRLARSAAVESPPLGWRLCHDPSYDNQVGCLQLGPDGATVRVETTAGSDWRDPDLRTVFEHRLL